MKKAFEQEVALAAKIDACCHAYDPTFKVGKYWASIILTTSCRVLIHDLPFPLREWNSN